MYVPYCVCQSEIKPSFCQIDNKKLSAKIECYKICIIVNAPLKVDRIRSKAAVIVTNFAKKRATSLAPLGSPIENIRK